MRITTLVYIILTLIITLIAQPATARIHDLRALTADPLEAEAPIAPRLEGLGNHHFAVTTRVPESQTFFDQGLRLTYAFNHSEALRAFKEAVRIDPKNAMAYWGWALVLGPNLNLPMIPEVVPQAFQAIQQAVTLKNRVSDRERAYIEALAERGTLVVAASGNDGDSGAVGVPSCIGQALSVGAVHSQEKAYKSATCSDPEPEIDQVACFFKRRTMVWRPKEKDAFQRLEPGALFGIRVPAGTANDQSTHAVTYQ